MVPWEIFTKEIRPDLHLDAGLEPQTWKELLGEFLFYDYSNEGFITFESARSLIGHYSEHLPVSIIDQSLY